MILPDQNTPATAPAITPPTDPRIAELLDLAKRVHDHKLLKGWSWEQMKEELPEFGSDKTLNKLLKGDTSELNIENQLLNYNICIAQIEGEDLPEMNNDEDRDSEALLPEITLSLKLREMLTRLMKVKDNNRLGIICIDGGGGKTSAARALQQKWKSRVRRLQCLSIWNDNPTAMLYDILILLGLNDKNISNSRHGRYLQVRERLNIKRKCLIFDEAHYMGAECLSVIVNLINDTRGEFIFLAKPLLWKKLERNAFEQCDQLKVNRLDELAMYDRLSEKDYLKFLRNRLPKEVTTDDITKAARLLSVEASVRGHLAFARDAVRKAVELSTTKQRPVDLAMITEAVSHVAKKLGRATD